MAFSKQVQLQYPITFTLVLDCDHNFLSKAILFQLPNRPFVRYPISNISGVSLNTSFSTKLHGKLI